MLGNDLKFERSGVFVNLASRGVLARYVIHYYHGM
jgi:hypothetical protein